MRISEKWLREWVSPKLDTQALAERLTLAGLEVSGLEPAGPDLKGVVVGEVRSVASLAQAERLKLCTVDIGKPFRGKKRILDIVCGAPNVVVGMKAPVALPGITLPDGVTVKEVEIRGTPSAGMLCSAAELGLAESAEGLLVLDPAAPTGQPVADYLALDDTVIDIELTPNRGDCLSVAGVAREVVALTGARLKGPVIKNVPAKSKRRFKIRLQAQRDCPRYVGRAIEGIDPGAVTPIWMIERLRRSGVRSISPVVDVTNYVMLELGQPMHAFDLGKLNGSIRVRHARENETLMLLDGTASKFRSGTLLIADDKGPIALAGIMGGLDSAVGESTRDLFLESAYFHPETIAGHARSLGLQTESSYRFERGVDPELQRKAIERATTLLLDIGGGRPGPVIDEKVQRYLPKRPNVGLRKHKIQQLLGLTLSASRTETILRRLGMRVHKAATGWRVTPPSYRFDIQREVDLVEELVRIHGYENLPSKTPRIAMDSELTSESEIPHERFKQVLVDRDYQEVITYSFVDPNLQSLIEPALEPLRLANPLSADMAAMRVSLWPALLQAIVYNKNRQQERVRLFELGRCFIRRGRDIAQERLLGGAVTGLALPEQWGVNPSRGVDFYDLKGDVEALMQITGRRPEFSFKEGQHPALHPGQAAEIICNGTSVGWLGALHPGFQAKVGLDTPVLVFELQISALKQRKIPQFGEVSKYPAIRRDLAVVVDEETPAQAVLDATARAAGELLVDLQLFDEYRGEGIDSGRKSLALGLTLQDSSRTLKEEVVESVMQHVISSLQSGLGAQLRRK
ncbi:MAG: phenylalanine--tRNA ligase subunit beta [Acidiferrobacterales bacterium]